MSTQGSPAPTQAPLLDYGKTAAQIGQDLATIREFASHLGLKNSAALCDEVDARLREHRFTVAVVGEFKTGKSTFVNALLGVDVVPTDVIPATATLNRMTYGMESRVDVIFKDGRREAVAFDQLKEYVTKEFVTPELLESLDEVVVHHPAPYLFNNVDIIDTPGLNDESAMTNVTLSVLPKIDAAILVISGLVPFAEYTRQFLEERLLSSDLGRVIFLVNRIGQLGGKENADRIVAHIEQRITRNVLDRAKRELGEDSPEYAVYVAKIGKPRVYGIDSYDALQGILSNDGPRFERSRFAAFQDGLRRFLNEDRGAIVLQVPVNRLMSAASEVLMTLELQRQTADMSLNEFKARRDAADRELDRLRQRKQDQFADIARQKDEAAEAATDLLRDLNDRLKAAVRDAVGGMEISDSDAAKGKETAEKIETTVNITVRKVIEQEMDRVAAEVNRTVAQATDQLQKLSADLQETVKKIAVGFTSTHTQKDQIGLAAIGAAALAAGGPLPVLGGIWSGYRQGGLAGAVTGGVTTFAATYVAALMALAIGLPATLPVAIGAALLGFFGGDRVTKMIFRGARAKTFKENAIAQTLKQIDDMNLERTLAVSVRKYVQDTFDHLTQMVSKDIDSVIENTQRTLEQLARQKEKQEVLTQEQARELDQIGERTRAVLERARNLNHALVERVAGAMA